MPSFLTLPPSPSLLSCLLPLGESEALSSQPKKRDYYGRAGSERLGTCQPWGPVSFGDSFSLSNGIFVSVCTSPFLFSLQPLFKNVLFSVPTELKLA